MYWPAWAFFNVWFRGYVGLRVIGAEHVPREGAVLICGNHRSGWDPPLVGALLRRRAWFIAKEELFRVPGLGVLLRWVGAYPVRRHVADRGAVRRSLEILTRRGVIVLFPEGHRSPSGEMGPAEPGAALMALRTDAVIVPVGIRGGYGFRSGIEVRFGEPFRLDAPPGRLRSVQLAELVERQVMTAIAALAGGGPGQALRA